MRCTELIGCLSQIPWKLLDLDSAPLSRAGRRHEVSCPDTHLHLAALQVPARSHVVRVHQRNRYYTNPALELGIRIRYRSSAFGVRVPMLCLDGDDVPVDEALNVNPAAIGLLRFLANINPCIREQVA